MSLFDWSSDTPFSIGEEILQAYYYEAVQFESFLQSFPSYEAFVEWGERATTLRFDMGELVQNTSLTNSKESAISRVQDLARKSFGQAKQGDIIRAAGGSGNEINWFVFVPAVSQDVAEGVLKEGLDIAQSIGTGVTSSLKMLKYLPFILVGAGALWIGFNSKSFSSLIGKGNK